jgi:hypothetical protein
MEVEAETNGGKTAPGSAGTALPQVRPTHYALNSSGISIIYGVTSFSGKPMLSYRNCQMAGNFSGGQINTQNTGIGTLVTVLFRVILDVSNLAAAILLPDATPNAMMGSAQFRTFLVLTNHNTGFIGTSRKVGPQEACRIVPMQGTASFVVF